MNKNISMRSLFIQAFFLLTSLSACVVSKKHNNEPNEVLTIIPGPDCKLGFIRPPGVHDCLNIETIIDPGNTSQGPQGLCPKNWLKLQADGYCLPKYTIIACGTDTFFCDNEHRDIIKMIGTDMPIECEDGSIIVAGGVPEFDPSGTKAFATTTVLYCGVVSPGKPTQG